MAKSLRKRKNPGVLLGGGTFCPSISLLVY